ncbi:SDR family oxidoreductase [Pseudomonas petrae]|uniref:SDR family oxidoreductase n=1 Tax=Pseudomonas petrae TaxID=2912190 RepID=A0ABS9I0H4_9PSED|nr:SDR family oxidoreductase [Pseudomonas petrae]MCF7535095.1 SDR family oxidoreductase [Pseudomonas petrae]MCF7541295.1 SDR family oxidoreductase [Pseudomonas petrae]MCF7558372.1 SDR family oxidoreductase [Pseudomonas petrae]
MTSTVLITGASTGFGRSTAQLFAAQGWNVIASMRNTDAGVDLGMLANVLVTRLDVQEPASIKAAISAGLARFGQIDVLINNAGFGLFGVFEGTSSAKIREQFDVNLFGAMDVTRQVLPHMRERKSGVIINVSSGAGVFGLPMLSIYTASKFALEGFSESLSYELASQGIVVKIVEPGGVISTGFGDRSAGEVAQVSSPTDYDVFISHTAQAFEGLREQSLSTSEDVARVIFDAASDGTDRLRYVATQDIEPMVRARRETAEESYMAMMRERFGLCVCDGDGRLDS